VVLTATRQLAAKFTLSVIFFAVIFAISGLRSIDIAVIIFLTSIQIAIGAFIWSVYRSKYEVSFAESVGMGAAIGFALALASSQIFRTLVPRSFAWVILPLFALLMSIRALRKITLSFNRNQSDNTDIYVIISGTVIALSIFWYWLIPTALALGVLTAWLSLRKLKLSYTKKQNYIINFLGLVGLVLLANALLVLSSLERIRNPVWWVWRFATIQDPDVLFGESMMHSAGMYGNSDNIFFAGAKIQYHWFSFAWNDTLNAVYQTDAFAVSGLAAPVIVIFVIMCLIVAFAGRFSNSRVSAPLLVLAVASMCAGPIPFIRLLHPYSYSFNFSLIYLFAFVILLLSGDRSKLFFNGSLVFLCTAVLLGTKVSSVVALVFGLLFANFVSLIMKDKNSKHVFLLSSISALAVSSVWYFIYYSANSSSSGSIKFGFATIFQQKAFMSAGLPVMAITIGAVSILFLIAYSFAGVFWIWAITDLSTRFALVFSLSGGISSLIFGVLFYDDGENLAYLIQTAIALILPVSVVALCNSKSGRRSKELNEIAIAAIFGLLAAKFSWFVFDRVNGNSVPLVYKSSITVLIPLAVGLFLIAITRVLASYKLRRASILVAVSLTTSATLGSYVSFAPGFYQAGGDYHALRVDDADTIIGGAAYRELLIWLRDNSQVDDLVATNRYCSDSYEFPPNCLALWNLTSAISRRQVLIEGLYPPQSDYLQVERENRRKLVVQFVNQPSRFSLDALVKYGVDWVVADHAVTKARSWGEFAEVRFANDAGSVLELKKFEN
jgi:hypothetical protein